MKFIESEHNNTKAYKADVSRFYDESSGSAVYGFFVYPIIGPNQHYGFWYENTKSYREAASNEIKVVIQKGGITKDDRVLDAGCGVGGAAIFIAQETGARVTGLTLSEKEVMRATQNARKSGVSNLAQFQLEDYTATKFPDCYFDVVYGIESICHAYPKTDFLREAFRVLKPGGKLIISDGYLKREPRNEYERIVVEKFIYGYALKELVTTEVMTNALKEAGFVDIISESKIEEVKPSVGYFASKGRKWLWLTSFLKIFNSAFNTLHRNFIAGIQADKGIEMGIADYVVHCAIKPMD